VHKGPYDVLRDQKLLIQFHARSALSLFGDAVWASAPQKLKASILLPVTAAMATIRGLPMVIFVAVAEAEGKGGKTSALEVEAEGEAEGEAKGLVFCI